jgi:gluconate 2-dehydrogenase gamma chain
MLKQMGLLISTAASLPMAARPQARAQALPALGEALISLTSDEAETLRSIIARIVPADENGPGALEARADRFIDRALAGTLKSQREVYRAGLAAIDAEARSAKGASFAKLGAIDQDSILTAMQTTPFFTLVRNHTIQATFCDPFYGGNHNFAGWNLIGYPGARIAVSANLQRIDTKPEPSGKSAYDYGMFNKAEF